jgi:hypothetical protein
MLQYIAGAPLYDPVSFLNVFRIMKKSMISAIFSWGIPHEKMKNLDYTIFHPKIDVFY